VSFVLLSGCGGSSRASQTGADAGTSIAAAVIAFVAPRDGADGVTGAQPGSFAQTAQSKVLDFPTCRSYPAVRAARITPMAALRS
jgi:hypothetical protein